MAEEKKDLVVSSTNLPAERLQSKKGVRKLDREDQMIPRLKLMQGLSPEVQDGLAKYGDLVNSLTKENYSKALTFVPINWWKTRIYWRARNEGGGILCRSFNAQTGTVYGNCSACKFKEWEVKGDEQIPSPCVALFNVLGAILKKDALPELIVASFLKTSFKQGKQFINLLNYKNTSLFNFQYTLFSESVSNDMGTFNILKYKDLNQSTPEDVFNACTAFYDMYADVDNLKVDDSTLKESEDVNAGQQKFDF